jgi:hypothetical protein
MREISLVAGFGESNGDGFGLRAVLVRVLLVVDANRVMSEEHRLQLSHERLLADKQLLPFLAGTQNLGLSPVPVGV